MTLHSESLHPHRTALTGIAFFALVLATIVSVSVKAGDWPTYRGDIERSGVTHEKLQFPLAECWSFRARHAPRPAWGDPKPIPIEDILELRRAHFDDVFQVVAAGDAVYFGSSANNKVYGLDATTGCIRWTSITGGPIRLAPTLVGDRLYVASDDGYAYCLQAQDGKEIWKFRAAPEDRRVLGHGKMISLWPSRTGVLVDDGTAYFGAGVFPAERVFLYAVDADNGQLIWKNDTTCEDPHAKFTPQGYLLASKTKLYAPRARISPAAFDRRDGRLLYLTSFGKPVGGSYAFISGDHVYTGTEQMVAFNQETRDTFAAFPGRKMIVTDATFYVVTDTELMAMDRKSKTTTWKTPCSCADELILAGDTLIAGGAGQVMAIDAARGQVRWTVEVDGAAKGLAVANGRLLVSTDKGTIYSFGAEGMPQHGNVQEPAKDDPLADSPYGKMFAAAADAIVAQTGVRRGYCLVWGCETGGLALELAKRTELMIYAVSPDAEKVAVARKALDAAGVYGARVCVEQWPLDDISYSDYFANLVVSETTMLTGRLPEDPGKLMRMVKPLGGTVMLGQPTQLGLGVEPIQNAAARRRLAHPALVGGELTSEGGTWVKLVRGPIPGAGNWTHQYANSGNTACGNDQVAKSPLGVLWFGRPGAGKMPNRHVRATGPLALDGRMFVQGENVVMAYDIYNGVQLWEREIARAYRPNASHDGGSLAVCDKGLFAAVGDQCLRLDLATGETITTYKAPPPTPGNFRRWGYVATDGKLLFGTRAARPGQSDAVFAVDIETGEQRWIHQGGRISHTTITIGDGQLFFVSTNVTGEQRAQVLDQQKASIAGLPESERAAAETALKQAVVRLVIALDKDTGKVKWKKPMDLTHCGNNVAAMYNKGVLTVFGVYLDGHYWQQFFAGEFASRRVIAMDASDGGVLWSKPIGFRVRPLIIDNTVHAEPWAFDLHTGEARTRVNPITGNEEKWQFGRAGHHCGLPTASPHMMFFRSLHLGYYDLEGDYGSMHFSGQRPGCWINFIPAGGLVLMPEASTGCMCDFPNHGTVVFKPMEEDKNKAWAYYSASGPTTPVKHLALNLGAAGDRRDASGKLWLAFPRAQSWLSLRLDGDAAFYPGGKFVKENSVYANTAETETPWLFASAGRGLRKCVVPLVDGGDGTALYRVRLAFADPTHTEPGQRVFDIKLQDAVVSEDYDIASSAGGVNRAVFEAFANVEVSDNLTIELTTDKRPSSIEVAPILHAIEIERERFVAPGCTPPTFVMNKYDPKKSGAIKIVNRCEEPFAGTLRFDEVEGFGVSTPSDPIRLTTGERLEIPVTISAGDVAAGEYEIPFKLLRSDGTVELERRIGIEHLGTRDRIVLRAVEDTYVIQRYPDRNWGERNVILADGGNQQMADRDHAVGLIRFQMDVPGEVVSTRLRIFNAGGPSGNSGRICVVAGPWEETKVTYKSRPELGREVAQLGRVVEHQTVERPLEVTPPRKGEFSLAIDPTSCDGVDYLSRETGRAPELIVEYEVEAE